MTGPEHYKKAEELVERGAKEEMLTRANTAFAEAQVHATLALAAATALSGYDETGMHADVFNEWDEACGVQPS